MRKGQLGAMMVITESDTGPEPAHSPSSYSVTSSSYSPVAGGQVTISAQLLDQLGNPDPVAGRVVTWSKTGSGGVFGSLTSTTDATGLATVTLTVSTFSGIGYIVTGTDGGGVTGSSPQITTVAAAAHHYAITEDNDSPIAGAAVAISAQLQDQYNNIVTIAGVVATWSKTGAGGSFASPTSTTSASGIATVNFTTSVTAGTVYAITATSPGAITGTSANITSIVGAASKYVVTSNTFSPVAGAVAAITAQLTDTNGNAINTAGLVVTWSKTGAGGSFATATSTTNGSGIATVNFTTSTTAGIAYIVTGTDTGALTGSTATITSVVGAAAKYIVTSNTYAPVAGAVAAITAQLTDVNNNPVATAGLVVTWSKTGSGGSFASATSTTNGSGVATVNFTTSVTSGTAYVVTGTDAGALTGSAATITSVPGSATKYIITSSDFAPAAGAVVTITAQLADANSNPVLTAGLVVTWSKTGTGGSFANPTSTTNGSGVATIAFTCGNSSITYVVTGTDTTPNTGSTANIVTARSAKLLNWISRLVGHGAVAPSSAKLDAIDKYYNACVVAGVDSLIISDILMLNDNMIVATTPFFNQAGNDPWTNHSTFFQNTDLSVNGLQGGNAASGKWLQSGIIPSSTLTNTSAGLVVYCYQTATTGSGYAMGCSDNQNSNHFALFVLTASTTGYCWRFVNSGTDFTLGTSGRGYLSIQRTASNLLKLYWANSSNAFAAIGTATGAQTGAATGSQDVWAFNGNLQGGTGVQSDYLISYAAVTLGMTATQAQAHYNAVQQFRVDLGGGFV